MFYKLKSNLKEFHQYFDDSAAVNVNVLQESREIKKDHALLVKCGWFNGDGSNWEGPEDQRPCFSERIVARIWKRHRAYWVAEVWNEGKFVLAAGHSKHKAAQVAKFILANVAAGHKFRSPGYVW
jgi:hypothetical protein